MNNIRTQQIIQSLDGLGTHKDTLYTNQEIIDLLKPLQSVIARGVFERTHAENLRDQDILTHFEALAKEYGLDETDTYLRFKGNMSALGYTIGTFIKGMKGERIARKALKLLSYDKAVQILYNIQLEDEDVQAEYDAIVIAPYGMFVVEVKNWGLSMTLSADGRLTRNDDDSVMYDLPGRMSIKEALLREHLGEIFPVNYHSMLLLSHEKAQLQDEYQQILVRCGGGISYEIRSYGTADTIMSKEQIQEISDIIRSKHKEQRGFCEVNCEEIVEDYATLMVQIETASMKVEEELPKSAVPVEEDGDQYNPPEEKPWFRRVDWNSAVVGLAAVILSGVATAIVTRKH